MDRLAQGVSQATAAVALAGPRRGPRDDRALAALCSLAGARGEWAGPDTGYRFGDGSGVLLTRGRWQLAAGPECWCSADAPDEACLKDHFDDTARERAVKAAAREARG